MQAEKQRCSPEKKMWGTPETRHRQTFLNKLGLHTRQKNSAVLTPIVCTALQPENPTALSEMPTEQTFNQGYPNVKCYGTDLRVSKQVVNQGPDLQNIL